MLPDNKISCQLLPLLRRVEWGESPRESVTVMPVRKRERISQIHGSLVVFPPKPERCVQFGLTVYTAGPCAFRGFGPGTFFCPFMMCFLRSRWGGAGKLYALSLFISALLKTRGASRSQDRLDAPVGFSTD